MPGRNILRILALTLVLGYSSSTTGKPAAEFELLSIIVERNATDGDTEIVLTAKPDSDQGLVKLTVRGPDGRKVVSAKSPRSIGGIREFEFETPEPPGNAILASYPEGRYRFDGKSRDGKLFAGTANLSHLLPTAPTIIFPIQDSLINSDQLTIRWSPIPDATEFRIELENESMQPEQALTLNVPAHVTSFDVPASLLARGANFQVGIAAVAANGNLVWIEVQFSTAK